VLIRLLCKVGSLLVMSIVAGRLLSLFFLSTKTKVHPLQFLVKSAVLRLYVS
jgi:hypothetical protein